MNLILLSGIVGGFASLMAVVTAFGMKESYGDMLLPNESPRNWRYGLGLVGLVISGVLIVAGLDAL